MAYLKFLEIGIKKKDALKKHTKLTVLEKQPLYCKSFYYCLRGIKQ